MNKMSLEERALRHADKFFASEDIWWHGSSYQYTSGAPTTCVGLVLEKYHQDTRSAEERSRWPGAFKWSSEVMGVPSVTRWNDALPSFKAMKSALKARIRHYKGLRT